jgi:type II secretory pathway predicted ATPase ExeA
MPETSPEDLKNCTVRISHEGGQNHDGYGFFVTPQLILTCAHVCQLAEGKPIYIYWQEQRYPVKVKFCSQDIETLDLALLELEDSTLNVPYVYLNESINIGDKLYNFGYPDNYAQGDSGTFEYVGLDGKQLFKFKEGLVRPGLSGSPLLNLTTKQVCGMIAITLDRTQDLGGRGIPIQTIFESLPELKDFYQSLDKKVYPNPFVPRTGKVEEVNLIFGRESEIKEIFETLNSGSGVALIGESGMGKSSLLRLIETQVSHQLNLPRKPIYLDLGNVISDNDFYYELCCQLDINCNYENPLKGIRLTHELKEHRLLLLLDGLRKDMIWEGFTNPVRNQLRSLANEVDAPLRLVVAADRPLTRLFADSGADSPFENVCLEIQLKPWDENTIRQFIHHRLAGTNVRFSESQIQELITKSQGNPQNLMVLCYENYKQFI